MQSEEAKKAIEFWKKRIKEWYPERHHTTLFYSALHFNRVPFQRLNIVPETKASKWNAEEEKEEGVLLLVPPGPQLLTKIRKLSSSTTLQTRIVQDSDIRDDRAIAVVRKCLEILAAISGIYTQVMMAIFGLNFRNYLKDDQSSGLATPTTLREETLRQGDFDMLLIHRDCGFIVGEVKSVGQYIDKDTSERIEDIRNKVGKAVDQLAKAEAVLMHLAKDLEEIPITKTLLLPNVAVNDLRTALKCDLQFFQKVSKCFGTSDVEQIIKYCLLKDRIPAELHEVSSWKMSDEAISQLKTKELTDWWESITSAKRRLSEEDYDSLLARFCGPATSVETPTILRPRLVLRTGGEAVLATAKTFSCLMLHQHQVDLLNDQDLRIVQLYGPPGTGKTLMLLLKAYEWLKGGKDVQVLNAQNNAVTFSLECSLKKFVRDKLKGGSQSVHQHLFDFLKTDFDVDKAVDELTKHARDGELYIIADEFCDFRRKVQKSFLEFCGKLKDRVPRLFLWAAEDEKLVLTENQSQWFVLKPLTVALRTPPAITSQLQISKEIEKYHYVLNYANPPSVFPTEGPPIEHLKHDAEPGHDVTEPADCKGCAVKAVEILHGFIGTSGGLGYSDVFILCPRIPKDRKLEIIETLQKANVPHKVISENSEPECLTDAVLDTNSVLVSDYGTVSGLERALVIVFANDAKYQSPTNPSEQTERDCGRYMAMSRTTGKLVWFGEIPEERN